jgi:hypothetical protein
MLLREILDVYSQQHTKHKYTTGGGGGGGEEQNAKFNWGVKKMNPLAKKG